MAACIGYGFWVGRDRPRAYFGLMLFLTGATVGVFVAQDLLLFYAFFEGMLIPLYLLIGVWGGARRHGRDDEVRHLHDGGLAAHARRDRRLRAARGTFDLVDAPPSASRWIFLGFMLAFAIKAPLFPFHGWLPDAYREAPPEVTAVLSGVIAKAGTTGCCASRSTKFPEPTRITARRPRARSARTRVRLAARVPRARLPRRRRVLVAWRSSGLITIGALLREPTSASTAQCCRWSRHGLISARSSCIAGAVERRTTTGDFSRLGGMAKGRPALATLLVTVGRDLARRARFCLRLPGSS